jgi:hypothetical protein
MRRSSPARRPRGAQAPRDLTELSRPAVLRNGSSLSKTTFFGYATRPASAGSSAATAPDDAPLTTLAPELERFVTMALAARDARG